MSLATSTLGRISRAVSASGSIVCFHGIRGDDDSTTGPMHVSVARLIQVLEILRASGAIVSLQELHRRWSDGASTRGLFAVTFDDAYVSLLNTVDEWYTRSPFPMTVFVVATASEKGASFWWDRLEALAPLLRDSEWERLEAAIEMGEAGHPSWGRGAKIRQWIVHRRAGTPSGRFEEELTHLEDVHSTRAQQRAMTIEELRRLGTLGPISFGPHTNTHRALSALTPFAALEEIQSGWDALGRWGLPSIVPFLAVPYGLMGTAVPELSRRSGLAACLALDDRRIGGPTPPGEPHTLSRLSMGQEVTPLRLGYRLTGLREVVSRESPTSPRRQ